MDPNPDYDASDEPEYGINWWAWILRAFTRRPPTRRSDLGILLPPTRAL